MNGARQRADGAATRGRRANARTARGSERGIRETCARRPAICTQLAATCAVLVSSDKAGVVQQRTLGARQCVGVP